MINKYPLWKNLLILFVVVLAGIYAAPNFYPADPAIQISFDDGVVDQSALDSATFALNGAGIEYFGAEIDEGNGLIRLRDKDLQSRAQLVINAALPGEYLVALNMAANTPAWLQSLGASPMTLGLDLSGGVHFLMEIDMEAAVNKQLNDSLSAMRSLLREERLRYRPPLLVDDNNRIVIRFADEEVRTAANRIIREEFPDYTYRLAGGGNDNILYYTMSELGMLEYQDYALRQNLTTLRSRVDELGVKEPRVQAMGTDRIIVQLPGIQDTVRAKELISAVATLELKLVAEIDAAPGTTTDYEYQGVFIPLENDVIISGESITNAQAAYDQQSGQPIVSITLDAAGARQMNEGTRFNVGREMAIVLIERKLRTETVVNAEGELVSHSVPFEETTVLSAPTINSALGRQFQITGVTDANDLALLIRSGALAAPMDFIEERTVGPSLGQENIDRGLLAVELGFVLVLVFMVAYYRFCGLAANIALAVNLLLLVAIMSIIGATLTLPGIAGIVLTVGMAVDANVLIFARIREELKAGASVQKAIDSGFGRAFVTIFDANITTLLVAIILYSIGTGPVKGFAVTLSVGIMTSMFTAIVGTRAIINLIYGGRNVKQLSIGVKAPAVATTDT